MSFSDRAMQTVLTTIGINADLIGGGTLVTRRLRRVIVMIPNPEAFPFDECLVQECDRLIVVDHARIGEATWLSCPQLASKVSRVIRHRVLVTVLTELERETQAESVPNGCTIECVFTKQMNRGINVIRHDVFGTLSTFGVGKRIIDGTATSEDFRVFAKRLAATMTLLERQAVDCSFIPTARHSFPHSMNLLRRITTILESPGIDASDLKHLLRELRFYVSTD